MREIKFRAWFKDTREMKSVAMNNLYMGNKSSWMHLSPQPMSDYRLVEIMQYAGLKVNGNKELFEGDIVPIKFSVYRGWKQGHDKYKCNAVVRYIDSEMSFMFVAYTPDGKRLVPFDKSIRQSYKIIGNIYENPELLEGEPSEIN